MASFQSRVIGAMTLNVATYEEVEHDASATVQAGTVVLLASISGAIGWVFYSGLSGIVTGAIFSLIGWVIGATVVWLIGTKLLPGPKTQADIGQVMRTVGFAQAPGLLGFVTIIPILGWFIMVGLSLWSLVAWVIAVRQALDYDDTLRAVLVCVIAWVAMFIVVSIGMLMFGMSAIAGGALSS
jgi:hypothetical protein